MRFHIGCQSITFGDAMHRENLEGVIAAVADAGFEGIETAFFRLDPGKGDWIRELLDARGLRLTALHIGGNIADQASQIAQMDNLDLAIRLVKALGGSQIFISGSRQGDFKDQAAYYDRLGARVHAAGLTLCYHNHDWEIEDHFSGLETLLTHTRPEHLSLVLDVGWVTRGRGDPARAVRDYAARLKHIHFKEFTADGGFAELGRGIVNFQGVLDVLKDRDGDMWIVAEQDQSEKAPALSVRDNYAYIRELLEG